MPAAAGSKGTGSAATEALAAQLLAPEGQANLDLAKEAFNDYLIQYPGHSRNAEARQFIANVGGKDLQRSYDIAEFYQKTGKLESAKVYYRDIVSRAKSGPLHDKAKARLKELGE